MWSPLRVAVALVLIVLIAGVMPAAAGAARGGQVTPVPCGEDVAPDATCGTVPVPLDRRAPLAATIPIAFRVYPHTDASQPALDPIFASEGGPGYSITQNDAEFGYAQYAFASLRDRHDLVMFDQRGTGLSGAVDCPSLQHGADDLYAAFAACAAQLGTAADVYGSGDVALDIEALRAALGIERLEFYGASYSTVDAQAYAARFPERLSAIVLDSPVKVVGYDSFYGTGAAAIARAVELVCKRSVGCSREHRHASADLAWLAQRLRAQPLDGVGIDATGNPHQLHVTEGFLVRIGYNDQGAFVAYAEVAAAASALRAGDPVPLLRLAAKSDDPFFGDEGDPTSFSNGDNAARFCIDQEPEWDKGAPPAARRLQWEVARAALAPGSFAPFSVEALTASPPVGLQPDPCIAWPAPRAGTPPAVPAGAVFPRIPVLVLVGDLDVGTPAADARSIAALFPKSRFVEIANTGHHTIFSWRSQCAVDIVASFLATFKPDTSRKVAVVAAAAVTDAFNQGLMTGEDGVGLRGGSYTIAFDDDEATLGLDAVRLAGDVAVSGTAMRAWETGVIDAYVTVDGPRGEDGDLHVTGAWTQPGATTLRIEGRLGRRAIALSIPAT
jgi:pimeloyl-ACP methyl ester carboxylesterase